MLLEGWSGPYPARMIGRHRQRPRRGASLFAVSAVVVSAVICFQFVRVDGATPPTSIAAPEAAASTPVHSATSPPAPTTTTMTATNTTTTLPPTSFLSAAIPGRPWGVVAGVTMFRGSPTRSWYGTGPLPLGEPAVLWRYPDRALCGSSTVGGETTTWCGTGWTGQPVVWDRPDGITEVIVGAYDHQVHFIDASTGQPTRAPYPTNDIIKGSVTLDPDGFPLLYVGSRDNHLRALALDREPVEEIWSVNAADHPGIWNNDWDSNPVVVEGLLLEGGENGFLFVFELNRGAGDDGFVTLEPVLLAKIPTWDPALIAAIGDRNASVESSIAVTGTTAYVTNSGGRVMGIDLTRIREEQPPIVFDFWAGDDTDATPVVDADGYLYIASELERRTSRSLELGQLMKLDPLGRGPEVVWSIPVPALDSEGVGGLWATPALGDGVLYAATHPGQLLAVDTATGEVTWTDEIGFHAWSSPVVIDGVLLVAVNCELGGALRAYNLTDPRLPAEMWEAPLQSGCIESTPAVWNGVIYVGSRDGYLRAWG